MINTRPNALSLAVLIAISSLITGAQAVAERRLQTKSINILVNGHKEYTHSEVIVRSTLGLDGQPIPKSSTTTYPKHATYREIYDPPILSFTQFLSVTNSDAFSIDLFETGENDVAQKYTKVLKLGDEGVFRFTHNLEETELVIEVRAGLTDQDSVEAVRARFHCSLRDSPPLEPLTKIASPAGLADVLLTVQERAGNLGPGDHYVALATVEVEKVEVHGRTFTRLIASGDQPPELHRLGQSLFVNDDALLAAATSAYMQVHVLGEDIQQQALNELLAVSKPVSYVVHVEGDTQNYPVPSGYPKLEVAEAPGEVIVFRGQELKPDDIAFVENLHNLWKEAEGGDPAPAVTTQVNKYQVNNYLHVIRSRQMAILEEFVTRYGAEISEDKPTTPAKEDKLATHALAFYEYLQQALANFIPDQTAPEKKFEFTLEHIRAASSVITPTWLQVQLTQYFSFKPVLRDLLNKQNFVQGIMSLIPVVDESQLNASCNDDLLAFKVLSDMARRLIESESEQAELMAREGKLIRVNNHLKLTLEKATTSEKQKFIVLQLKQQAEDELDRQMARLRPEPRYVLDREVARARRLLEEAGSELAGLYRKLNNLRGKHVLYAGERADLQHIPGEGTDALTQAMKKVQIEWGLTAGDEQSPRERFEDIQHFLREYSAEKREKVVKEPGFKENLNIRITGDLGLVAEAGHSIAIALYAGSYGQKEANEALGELLLTRKKYIQITELLRKHDRKTRKMNHALIGEISTQDNPDLKKEEITRSGHIDEKAKTAQNNEIATSGSVTEQNESVSEAEDTLADPDKAILEAIEAAVGLKPDSSDTHEQRINALRKIQVQLGGHDGTGGKIQQLTQERVRLEREIEIREADFERMKEDLKAAEKAVENDGGPFQFSPEQVNILAAMETFTQQHSLKQQALDAALGLAESAANSGKTILCLTTFDFDDEFAPIRLQTLVGDDLTFNQASRIVEVFKNLKTSFPPSPFEPVEDQPQSVIEQVQALADRARHEMKTGAQQYDDEIRGMGKRAIHFVVHESGDLKGLHEYFASHSASGNKIIALLREGLISRVELGNYIKAVRGVDGYQTVDEFEHFLGYKHGVNVPHFKAIVRMLSDKSAEKFMQSAFMPVALSANGPAAMKESIAGMKEYAAAVIANYVLDDIAFDNGRRTAAFLANVQDTLTPYANAVGLSETELIEAIHGTLMQAHAVAVEYQLNNYWGKPSAFLVQAVTWYFSGYKPLLATHTTLQAVEQSLLNMSLLYLLDLTHRGDYLHRMLIPFQHWLERLGVDPDRTGQYAYHRGIEKVSELGGLAMPLGKAASSVILLRTGAMLFARQHNANPQMYRSISRLVPELVKSMGSGQGVQVPLLHRATPQKVKTLASATAGLVLGPVATVGAYAHGLISGFTYAQTFGFALASSLTFDFFMNDNKMLTQWLGGPLGRSLDKINRWIAVGETQDNYVQRTAIASPQRFSETDEEYANRVKTSDMMPGWTRQENYLQFRERRDRTMKLFENGWEKYFRKNMPKWSFSHAESIPYFYTLGAFYRWQKGDDQKVHGHDKSNAPQSGSLSATMTH
ncbi:hypothetical protein [Endozoicomonas sp. 8E]|uniref:hypothetical protein n=1 Tax=Endozoicomonas sp. 8E TaxID=3035692 RepID=UPI0029393862|nr:hypothetical protein [Endozoicomonas sp. 8E]WOG29608.1 hypothetical protein P6910_08130 [Endozoicomonas sp. 8E]